MIQFQKRFLKPNKDLRELHALTAIEKNPRISQHRLAREVGISSAMANAYVKDLVAQGRVARTGHTNRTIRYMLTPEGQRRRRELLLSSSIEIIQLYGLVRAEFEARVREIAGQGVQRLALFGAAETGEVAMAAARRTTVQVVAVTDNDPELHGTAFGGLTVLHPDRLYELDLDGVLITSFAHSTEIHEQLLAHEDRGVPVFRL